MTRHLTQWCVRKYEPGWRPETVFVADSKEEAVEFARECRADTVGKVTFRVLHRDVFQEAAEAVEMMCHVKPKLRRRATA